MINWVKAILFGPILGIPASILIFFAIGSVIQSILWSTNNHMSGPEFNLTISAPLLGSIYSFFFVYVTSRFAPIYKLQVATIMFIIGGFITYLLFWKMTDMTIGHPVYGPKTWQPFWVTLISGTVCYVVAIFIHKKS